MTPFRVGPWGDVGKEAPGTQLPSDTTPAGQHSATASIQFAPIPEPGTAALLALGLSGLATRGTRRRAR